MTFTPDEIETKSFIVTFRGYDRAEVQAFLAALADDYRTRADQQTGPKPIAGSAAAGEAALEAAAAAEAMAGVRRRANAVVFDALEYGASAVLDLARVHQVVADEVALAVAAADGLASAELSAKLFMQRVDTAIRACQVSLNSCEKALWSVASMFAAPDDAGSPGGDLDRPGRLGPALAAEHDAGHGPPPGGDPQIAVQRE